MAEGIVPVVSPDHEVAKISEGEEDDQFWSSLGGQDEYQQLRDTDAPLLAPRLFHCVISPAGNLRVDEVDEFTQEVCISIRQ